MRGIRFAIAFAVAWSLQAGVSFAAADWLDKLSGPGPFKELFTTVRLLCFTNTADQEDFGTRSGDKREMLVTPLNVRDRTATVWPQPVPTRNVSATDPDYRKKTAALDCKSDQRLRGYLVLNTRTAWTEGNILVAPEKNLEHVRIYGIDIGYVNRLGGAFDIGLALGLNRFSGPAFVGTTSTGKEYKPFYRGSLSTTLEFSPFAVASDDPRAHWLKLVIGSTMFLGDFDKGDFCKPDLVSCSEEPFRTGRYDIVPRLGLIIDTSVVNLNCPIRQFFRSKCGDNK